MLVSRIAGVASGEMVLDVAAAPGGKATHMAQLMENRGKIVAWDIHPHRVKLIEETCKRLGVSIVEAKVQDAIKTVEKICDSFDKVILDAPCSGLGVIRRKPDIKWTKTAGDIVSLKNQQLKMLDQVCQYVKPGGVLIYSTCSIDLQENEEVIKEFLRSRQDFVLEDLTPYLPQKLKGEGRQGYIKLFPHLHDVDGFFIARLKRTPAKEM